MNKFLRVYLITALLSACSTDTNQADEVRGDVRSSFENFSFTAEGDSNSHWINFQSDLAEDWNIFDNIHQSLLKRETQLKSAGEPYPIIYICVSGVAKISFPEEGAGHMRQWKSDITFTEITSAKVGKCDNS